MISDDEIIIEVLMEEEGLTSYRHAVQHHDS